MYFANFCFEIYFFRFFYKVYYFTIKFLFLYLDLFSSVAYLRNLLPSFDLFMLTSQKVLFMQGTWLALTIFYFCGRSLFIQDARKDSFEEAYSLICWSFFVSFFPRNEFNFFCIFYLQLLQRLSFERMFWTPLTSYYENLINNFYMLW